MSEPSRGGRPQRPVRTLEEPRDVPAVRRARRGRRLGLVVLAGILVAGATGVLGVRSTTASGTAGGVTLSVRHAQVTRAGLAVPLHLSVRRQGGFDGPVVLAVDADLLERFDFQNFYPNPSAETASAAEVVYEFDPPPGDELLVSLDGRTAPDQNGSSHRYTVRLLDGEAQVVAVSFRMWVVP